MAGTIGNFKADHHTIFGLALVTVGIFGVIGSLTGQLAVMLAALFDPGDLIPATSTGGSAPLVPPSAPEEPTSPEEPTQPETPSAPELPVPETPGLGGLPGLLELLGGA